jgi:hypothetical protein
MLHIKDLVMGISLLFATLAGWPINVAYKGFMETGTAAKSKKNIWLEGREPGSLRKRRF